MPHPQGDYLPTWYRRRIRGGLGSHQKIRPEQAAACADTPGVIHFDSLGRNFLTVADNGRDAGARRLTPRAPSSISKAISAR